MNRSTVTSYRRLTEVCLASRRRDLRGSRTAGGVLDNRFEPNKDEMAAGDGPTGSQSP